MAVSAKRQELYNAASRLLETAHSAQQIAQPARTDIEWAREVLEQIPTLYARLVSALQAVAS